ncbi:MAG: archease [Candidatus Lokiarchaeota archaeon]|nr:archease [Candidatus Lokiarchaeota archaeon]
MPNFYEFKEHPADIQVHAVGNTLEEAIEQVVIGMMDIMTSVETVDTKISKQIKASAPDLEMLVVDYLTEYLFFFDTEQLLFSKVKVSPIEFDEHTQTYQLNSVSNGESFDSSRHEMKTEIKAVTYSFLEIQQKKEKSEIWIIFDL